MLGLEGLLQQRELVRSDGPQLTAGVRLQKEYTGIMVGLAVGRRAMVLCPFEVTVTGLREQQMMTLVWRSIVLLPTQLLRPMRKDHNEGQGGGGGGCRGRHQELLHVHEHFRNDVIGKWRVGLEAAVGRAEVEEATQTSKSGVCVDKGAAEAVVAAVERGGKALHGSAKFPRQNIEALAVDGSLVAAGLGVGSCHAAVTQEQLEHVRVEYTIVKRRRGCCY